MLPVGEHVHECFFRLRLHTGNFPSSRGDTLLVELQDGPVVRIRALDEYAEVDIDVEGNICSMTIEHALDRAGIPRFWYAAIAA